MNAWDHLPNAKHIDRVLDSLKRNPMVWEKAFDDASEGTSEEAWVVMRNEAKDTAHDSGRDAIYDAVYDAIMDDGWGWTRVWAWKTRRAASRYTILALIAYDDIAHMLDSTPDELRVLIALGDDRAIMMLPAAIVLNITKSTDTAC